MVLFVIDLVTTTPSSSFLSLDFLNIWLTMFKIKFRFNSMVCEAALLGYFSKTMFILNIEAAR